MRALFPAIPGTLVTSFDADIEGRGQVHVELWQSASSISRILRWPIGDTGLFREAAADEAYLRLEVPFDVEPPWLADRGLVVENVLDEGTLLRVRLLDPLGFWLDLEAARERMGNSVDIEFQAVLRVIPDSLPSQRLNLDDDLNRIGARIWLR
jgi:hypothetical protein